MSVWRILHLVRGQLPRLALAALVAAAAELSGIALIATATWLLATAAEQPPLPALTVAIVSVRAFAIGRGVLRYLDRLVGHDAVLRALSWLRVSVFRALEPLAPMGARLFRGGDLLTRFVSDVDAVQDLLLRVIVPMWTAAAVAIAAIGFTAAFSPPAALVLTGCMLASGILLPLAAAALARRFARRTVTRRAALAASTIDLIHGSADLAAYGATDAAVKRGETDAAELARAERTGSGVVAAVTAAHALIAGAGVLGVLLATDGLGVMTAVLALTALVAFEALAPLPQAARRLVEVRSATDRIVAILDAEPPVPDPARPQPAPEGDMRLTLTDAVPALPARATADFLGLTATAATEDRGRMRPAPVAGRELAASVGLGPSGDSGTAVETGPSGPDPVAGRESAASVGLDPSGDLGTAVDTGSPRPQPTARSDAAPTATARPALADIDRDPTAVPRSVPPVRPGVSLDLPPGKRVAIVGASGAGKTMLLSMLVRFTAIAHGRVSLGGVDLEALPGTEVRAHIGGMLTDAHVFNTDVRENLLVADPEATDEALRAALTRAGLPELDLTVAVGEDGRSLSGGQRQRLLLARALLGRHAVLLLDEPTEHLDPDTAEAVMADLVSATDGRSLVCVTHHLAHLDAFDEIIVLESGGVAERGTMARLLAGDGPFRRLAGTFAVRGATTEA